MTMAEEGTKTIVPPAPEASAKGIQVTDKAIIRIRGAMAKEGISPQQGGLRLGVQGGGCSGLSYSVWFDTQPRERDRTFQFGDIRVFVDPKSFIYLRGMTLDDQETLMQRGFVFVNPNSTRSCGDMRAAHFCSSCGKVQPPAPVDYFTFFGLPRKLNLDTAALEVEFYELSRRLHPDVYGRADSKEQHWSLEKSSQLNDAYRIL